MAAGAHHSLGTLLFFDGQLEAAREHLERAIALLDSGALRNSAEVQLGAPGSLAAVLSVLGYPVQALRKSGEFLSAMRRRSDPTSIARGLFYDAMVHADLRDSRTALERAEELLPIASQHEMRFYATHATFHRGWAIAGQERGQEGIAEMCRAMSVTSPSIGTYYAALGESYGNNGRPEEGLATIAEGFREGEQTPEKVFDAEASSSQVRIVVDGRPT